MKLNIILLKIYGPEVLLAVKSHNFFSRSNSVKLHSISDCYHLNSISNASNMYLETLRNIIVIIFMFHFIARNTRNISIMANRRRFITLKPFYQVGIIITSTSSTEN